MGDTTKKDNKKDNMWDTYIKSKEWKCTHAEVTSSNPHGAHHWVGQNGTGLFECKYCHAKRHFDGGLGWYVSLPNKAKVLAEELVEI